MKNYREILRELREDKDLKQFDVAHIVGTSQQYYSKYETGEHELPVRALIILADYFGVSADYILGRTQCMKGIDVLNQKVNAECTAGEMLSDFLALDESGRTFVLECLSLQKLKANCSKEIFR